MTNHTPEEKEPMKIKLQEILEFIHKDVETKKTKDAMKKTLKICAILLSVISLVMSIINYEDHRTAMFYSTAVLSVVFLICAIIVFFHYNEGLIKCIVTLTIGGIFSFYIIIGGNNGFALLWTVLTPFAYIAIIDFEYGILIGSYFQIFIILFFWTPLQRYLLYDYPTDTLQRYPIFYMSGLLLAIVVGTKEKRLRIIEFENDQRLKKAVIAEQRRVERVSVDAISSICHALDAKDSYTGQHSEHVAFYTRKIAERLGMSSDQLDTIERAARLHDLGKIGISDTLLNKSISLTDEEYLQMKQHVIVGPQILSEFTSMPELMVGARYHHEWYDGTGYAEGLSGEDIPLEGRIIAIADSIDAMYSTRSYRDKVSIEYVKEEIIKGMGTQFDPKLAKIAIQLIDEGMLDTM